MVDSVQLAALLCARFCHDLGSLVGSLNGVLELATETPGDATEEIALASATAQELAGRLLFLRAAWGGTGEAMDLPTLVKLINGGIGSRRITLNTEGITAGGLFPPGMARVALNVVLLALEAMPRGGELALSGDPTDRVVARIAGPNAAWPSGLARCIGDEAYAWSMLDDPRTLHVPLTSLIARAADVRLSMMMAATAQATPPLLLTHISGAAPE